MLSLIGLSRPGDPPVGSGQPRSERWPIDRVAAVAAVAAMAAAADRMLT